MSSRPDIHIQASFLTLHCDIVHWNIISSLFFLCHISPLVIFVLCLSFIIAYLALSVFHLGWWFFTRHCMEDCHILSYHSPHGRWFRDVILRGCLVSEDSCYISTWGEFIHLGMYFHGSAFVIDQSMRTKKKMMIAHYSFYHSPLGMGMDMPGCFIEFMC